MIEHAESLDQRVVCNQPKLVRVLVLKHFSHILSALSQEQSIPERKR